MAVYTHVSDDEIQALLLGYGDYELISAHGISKGVENTNYLLNVKYSGGDEKLILTLFEKRVDVDDLPFFLKYMRFLSGENIPCPKPLMSSQGDMISIVKEKSAAICSFLEGSELERVEKTHLTALGKKLGEMHLSVKRFPFTRENALSPDKLHTIYDKISGHMDRLQQGLSDEVQKDLKSYVGWENLGLPKGVVHIDLFRDNVLFVGNEVSGVLDFYFSASEYFAYDLMIAVNDWCFEGDGTFSKEKASALIRAYHEQRPLSDQEWELLPLLARAAAVRFLLTRAYDKLFQIEGALVQVKDPIEYYQKWQFHKAVRSADSYSFA